MLYLFYPVDIRLHLRSSTTSRQPPRLGLLCSRHRSFRWPDRPPTEWKGHSAGGAATNAAPWCGDRDPVRGRETHLEGGWSFNFGELLETWVGEVVLVNRSILYGYSSSNQSRASIQNDNNDNHNHQNLLCVGFKTVFWGKRIFQSCDIPKLKSNFKTQDIIFCWKHSFPPLPVCCYWWW